LLLGSPPNWQTVTAAVACLIYCVRAIRWVDRLGRNFEDVSDNIREFMRRGVVIKTIINGMTYTVDQISQVVSLSGAGEGVSTVAKRLGLSRAAVYRILKSPSAAFASV
jgi:DNA invertase Pin-like site-specific DNA recombinase